MDAFPEELIAPAEEQQLAEEQQFIDLDMLTPPPVRLPAEPWVDFLNDAKDEFEFDGARKILKRTIILKDIAGEDVYNSNKHVGYRHRNIELIVHNGHAWFKETSLSAK